MIKIKQTVLESPTTSENGTDSKPIQEKKISLGVNSEK